MGLDFSKLDVQNVPSSAGGTVVSQVQPVSVSEEAAISKIEGYDVALDGEKYRREIADSAEVDALVSSIDLNDNMSILTFGQEVSEEIGKAAGVVLDSTSMATRFDEETTSLMNVLNRIMDKFDMKELDRDGSGLFGKMFGGLKKQLDSILSKYQTMGDEVGKIYVQLKSYEAEIHQANQKLSLLFDSNVDFFRNLEKYIVAGDKACEELRAQIEKISNDNDVAKNFQIQKLNEALNLLEARVADLQIAEGVALTNIPMLKTQEVTNYNLIRKIYSSIIITLPVFKQALAQAVLSKRQKLQAESLSALDKRTEEMLKKNAANTMQTAKMAAKLASGTTISMETLENTWRTIMNGIDEVNRIHDDARRKRETDKRKLENIKQEFDKKFLKQNRY